MHNAIVYQAYGGIDFINECRYSLLNYLHVYNLKPPATAVFIYTDQPHLFSDFLPFFHRLECVSIDAETVKRWCHPQLNFVHRFKIEMLLHLRRRFTGNLLYLDTDAYAIAPLEDVFDRLAQGRFYMHECEGFVDKTKTPSLYKWEKFLETTPLTYNGKQLYFNKDLQLFNAGVVGLPLANEALLPDVLALTDSIYQKFPKHIAEQFAFSYCLQKAGTVHEAKPFIAHYWNLKEFRQLLQVFFERNTEEGIPALVKKAHRLDALAIMREKDDFERLPFRQRFFKKLTGRQWRITAYEKAI